MTETQNKNNFHFIPLKTEEELDEKNNKDIENKILAGIVFNDNYFNYTIKIKINDIANSNEKAIMDYAVSRKSEYIKMNIDITNVDEQDYISYEQNDNINYNNYKMFGKTKHYYIGYTKADTYKDTFVPIQIAIDNIIINLITNRNVNGYTANIGKLSKPEIIHVVKDKHNYKYSYFGAPNMISFISLAPFIHIILKLKNEKKSGIRDGLISIGVKRFVIWLSWIISYLPFNIISIIIFLVIDPIDFMKSINIILLFIILFLYSITAMEIAVFFCLINKNSKFLILIYTFLFFYNNILTENLRFNCYEIIEKFFSLIFSPICIIMSFNVIKFENNRNGYIGFRNIFKSEFGIYLLFIIIDIICYFLIIVFTEFFIYDRNHIILKSKPSSKIDDHVSYALDIQEDPTDLECYVQVRNINKHFRYKRNHINNNNDDNSKIGKIFTVNNNISFNVYKNEIFAILGHNGAGKTTIFNIMTGLLKPDNGEVYYNGLPLSKNKKMIQYYFGICLEKNVLIKDFTVSEHYNLYAGIKGVYNELEAWLKDIDLYEKRDCKVQFLSIGQKRKLCVGLAFIGDPKYVFLDEPTTGLDPLSRQNIWKLLIRKKQNRVIFITTHDMDEADIISDRKMILKKGTIRCLGSSVFLKKHFQMKYNLEVETNKPKSVEEIIKYYIPEAEYFHNKTIVEENKLLPSNPVSSHIWKLEIDSSPLFSYLIKHLEEEKQKGDILTNFLVSGPRLQELFIHLNSENENKNENENESFNEKEINQQNISYESTDNLIKKKERKSKIIDIKSNNIEIPNHKSVKKPNELIIALRIAKYRFLINYRDILFIGVTILLPFFSECLSTLKLINDYKPINLSNFGKHEISSKMYSNQILNYDINNSVSIIDTITPEIFQQEPNNFKIETQSSDLLNSEICNKNNSNLFTHEPYYISSISGELKNNLYNFSIYYNDSMPHSLPSIINSLSNAIITSNSPSINTTIQVNSHPLFYLDINLYIKNQNYAFILDSSFYIGLFLFFCGSNVVKERTNKLLNQFQINGISNFSYWTSLFINDYIWFIISCTIIILSFLLFNNLTSHHLSVVILLGIHFLLNGISCILFQYIVSFLFNNKNIAVISFFIINVVPCNLMLSFAEEIYTMKEFSLKYFFGSTIINFLLPCFSHIGVIRYCLSLGMKYEILGETNIWNHIFSELPNKQSAHFIGSIINIIIYIFILKFIIKKKYMSKYKNVNEISKEMENRFENELKNQDEDVYYEYKRIKADSINEIPIKVINLIKEYDNLKFSSTNELKKSMNRIHAKYGEYHLSAIDNKKVRRVVTTAFENINLGINKYECFGLLGPNGSGKTSFINTLCFNFSQSAGDIIYEGKNILDRKSNEFTIGYCPQVNILWEEMTFSEHIEMILYIHGFSRKESKRLTKQFIEYCHLIPHRNKYPSEMSGGTRRKLNILMALCCDSTRIILDEPSTGMDPLSRHYIWEIIKSTIQQNQSSCIMATHSMEEAELLCNRIGIIVNGKLQCIGSPEHLRMKYGHTYILDVHTENIERFHKEVVVAFNLFGSDCSFKKNDISEQRVKYEIQHINTSNISRVFEIMEACRDIYVDNQYLYIDYSYSQTSLEEVYINFARLKENSDDNNNSDYTIIV